MKGIEQGGAAGPGAELPGLPIEAPEAQAALMLLSYREAHTDQDIQVNPADWEQNDVAIQNAAMSEWVGDPRIINDPNSQRARYRAYIDAHPHARIDTSDEESMRELLGELGRM